MAVIPLRDVLGRLTLTGRPPAPPVADPTRHAAQTAQGGRDVRGGVESSPGVKNTEQPTGYG